MARKIRPDSIIGNLPPDLKDEVDEMLLNGSSYKEVKEFLFGYSVSISQTSVRDYWLNWLQPSLWERQSRTAAVLDKMEATDLEEATLMAIRQQTYQEARRSKFDPKTVKLLFDMKVSQERLDMEKKRLELDIRKFQTMAAQSLLDKALSPEVQAIVGGTGSNEEKLRLLRPLLFGQEKNVTPNFVQ